MSGGFCKTTFNSIEEQNAITKTGAVLARKAAKTLYENKECLVSKFILDNPHVKAIDIEIVQRKTTYGFLITVRKKEG